MNEQLGEIALPAPEANVLDRIRYLIRLSRRNQNQFSELAGIDPTILSKILGGKLRVSDSFLNRLVVNLGVSKDWLREGTDVPYPRPEHARTFDSSVSPAAVGAVCTEGAPVYAIDVTAGCRELSRMFTDDRIVGRLNLPGVDPAWAVVSVSGDSMAPRIQNGGYIAIRPIRLNSPISWGQIYVVVLDDYRLVKYVRRHKDKNMVILHSANPEYDDMEISRDDIRGLYLVEVIMNYEITA